MVSPYYVQPGGNLSQGLSGLGQVIKETRQEREQIERAQAEKDEADKRMRMAQSSIGQMLDIQDPLERADAANKVALEFPEYQEMIYQGMGVKDKAAKERHLSRWKEIAYAPPEKRLETLEKQILDGERQGLDMTQSRAELEQFRDDPETFAKVVAPSMFASLAPAQEWEAYKAATAPAEMPKTRELTSGEEIITQEFDPATGAYKEIARAPRFQSKEAANEKADVTNIQMPDGSVKAFLDTDVAGISEALKGGGAERGVVSPAKTITPKEIQTAKGKIQIANMLKQQIAEARGKFKPIEGSYSAGPEAHLSFLSEKGQNFDASVDALRSTVTALTRTPGVGSMSDYESRLDQSKIPNRTDFESTTLQKLDQLETLADQVISGYSDMLGDSEASVNTDSQTPKPGDVVEGYRFKGGDPSSPSSWEKVAP